MAFVGNYIRRFQRFWTMEHIGTKTQDHLKRVYTVLCGSLLVAALGAFVQLKTGVLFVAGWLSSLGIGLGGPIGMLIWLANTRQSHSDLERLGILAGFAFLMGLGLGPVLDYVLTVDPSIIPTAFIGTATIFICFSLSALFNRDRRFLYLGGILLSALLCMLLTVIANIFIMSETVFKIELYIGFVVMCAFVLYDTQNIIIKHENWDHDYIWHSVDLFLDFISIFRRLMLILSGSRDKDD